MSIKRYFPEGIPKAIGPYSPATQIVFHQGVVTSNQDKLTNSKKDKHQHQNQLGRNNSSDVDLVFVSGQIPINPQTNQIENIQIQSQTHQVMKNLSKALQGSGCSLSTVLKTTILLTDMGNFGKVNQIYAGYFNNNMYPARICYAVKELPKGSLVQIDAIAIKVVLLEQGEKCSKKVKITKQ